MHICTYETNTPKRLNKLAFPFHLCYNAPMLMVVAKVIGGIIVGLAFMWLLNVAVDAIILAVTKDDE